MPVTYPAGRSRTITPSGPQDKAEAEAKAKGMPKAKPNKYGAKKQVVDGLTFDSQAEARRWSALRIMEKAGKIEQLQRQVNFKIEVNGYKICAYRADFVYLENGKQVVEDCKGMVLPEFILKAKLILALYGIEIKITK